MHRGFAVAKFSAIESHPAEQGQTEIPNLLLQVKFVGKKCCHQKNKAWEETAVSNPKS